MDLDALISRLLATIRCPVDWDIRERNEDLADRLSISLWYDIAATFQVDMEAEWIRAHPSAIQEESLEDLTADLVNIQSWIERARKQYVSLTRRFWALRVAGPIEYDKHYPFGGDDLAAVRARTARTHVSCLFPGIRAADLSDALWAGLSVLVASTNKIDSRGPAFELLWQGLLNHPSTRVAFDTLGPVGAEEGSDSSWLCYDIDASSPVAHAYPVSEQEARQIMGVEPLPAIDDLQSSGRRAALVATECRRWGTVRDVSVP